jgi:outer membrane receptor protein involved in Fe transport
VSLAVRIVLCVCIALLQGRSRVLAQMPLLDGGADATPADASVGGQTGVETPLLPVYPIAPALDASTPQAQAETDALMAVEPAAPLLAPMVAMEEVTVSGARKAGPGEFALHGTGSKVQAPLEKIPATVSVVPRETLHERGATDVQSALELLPGLTPMWTYGGFQSTQVRGFTALMLFDGRRDVRSILSGSSPFTSLFDLERIEVLRGPSAVLYGYGAVGGTVNLIRRRASSISAHELEAGLGTPRRFQAHAGSQGAIGSTLSYRADLGHVSLRNFRGYESSRSQGTTALQYAPNADHTLQLRLAYAFDRYNTDVGIPTIEDPRQPGRWGVPAGTRYQNRYSTQNDGLDYQRLELGLDYRYDLTPRAYLDARAGIVRDRYAYLAAESLTYVPARANAVAQVEREYLALTHSFRPIMAQLELHADVLTGPLRHQLVVGYTLDHLVGSTNRDSLGGAVPSAVDFVWPIDRAGDVARVRGAIDHRRHVMHSAYAFDHLQLAEPLTLVGGVRVDTVLSRTRREFLDPELQVEIPDPKTGRLRTPNRTTDVAPSGQVGVVYRPVQPLIGYASYATGYRPQFVSASATSVTRYDPEQSHQFEGGVRVRFDHPNHALEADAAGYLIRRKNLLVPRGLDEQVPAGLAQSRGVDLSFRYAAFGLVEMMGAYALIDSEYVKFVAPSAVTGDNVDLSGKTLRLAPRHAGQVWLRMTPLDRVRVGIGSRIRGRQYADDENRLRLPRYGLLDASLTFGQGITTFTLSANNLLNRVDYFTSVINSGSPQPQVTPGAGREVLGVMRVEL